MVSERASDDALALAAFNWTDEPRTVAVDPGERVGADGTGSDGVRCWDALAAELVDAPVEQRLEPHDAAVLHCAPARDRPHLVGSRHLANATDQVVAVDWDETAMTLSVELDADRAMELVAAVPEGWTVTDDDAPNDDAPNDRVANDDAGGSVEGVGTTRFLAEAGRTTVAFERRDSA